MRASNWIVAGVSVLSCAAVAFCADASSTGSDLSERIRIQEERLPEIERVAAQETEQVEQWYARRRTQLAQETARRVAAVQLNHSLRFLWTEFGTVLGNEPYLQGYYEAPHYAYPLRPEAAVLRDAMIEEYFVSRMADLLLSEDFREKLIQIVSESWQTRLLQDESARLLTLMEKVHAELIMDLQMLENQKKEKLEAISRWERDLQEQVSGILNHLREKAGREPQLGVVESIGYGPQGGYFCTIEGVNELLRPGDTARGVRVVSIDPEKVEFSKEGTVWTQVLGGPAQPYWD